MGDLEEQSAASGAAAPSGGSGTRSRHQFALPGAPWIGIGLAVVTVAALGWGLLTPAGNAVNHGRAAGTPTVALTPAPFVGHVAPDVTFLDLANNRVALSSLRGDVVVLNFWYTACDPCRYEMPILERVYHADKAQRVVVVGVNITDDAQTISTYIGQLGIDYPVLRDLGQRAVIAFQITSTPTSIILDRHGVVRARAVGAFTDTASLNRLISPWLSQV
jgi:thiol-disulfide isomerase/thioredoxin